MCFLTCVKIKASNEWFIHATVVIQLMVTQLCWISRKLFNTWCKCPVKRIDCEQKNKKIPCVITVLSWTWVNGL